MDFLAEIIFDMIGDIFEKLARKKPGRPSWVRVTATVLTVVTMLSFFIYGAYASWQTGDSVEMYVCLGFLAISLILLLVIVVRWIIRILPVVIRRVNRNRREKEEWD